MLSTLVAGCAQGPVTPPDHTLQPPAAGQGLQLKLGRQMAPGEEAQFCQYVIVPEGPGLDVNRFEHAYSAGSHHLLLFQTNHKAAEVTEGVPFACDAVFDSHYTGIAYEAQVGSGELVYPEGVAMHFDGGQVLVVQSHYLNVGTTPLAAEARLNLWYAKGPVTAQAGTLFFYDYSILVPPMGTATARMHCEIPKDVNMLFAMPHMHRRGVGYEATLDGQPLLATTRWDRIEPTVFKPTVAVKAGQAIDFHCDFQNDGETPFLDGPSADKNEMCMFIANYYPKIEPAGEFCVTPGSGPVYEGGKLCRETVSCLQSTKDPVVRKACVTATCEKASGALNQFLSCLNQRCPTECPDGDHCSACAQNNCGQPLAGCLTAACD